MILVPDAVTQIRRYSPYDGSSTAANLQTQYQSSLLYKLAKSTSTNGQCVSNGCKILPPSPKGNAPGPLYQWTTGLDANSSSTALYSPSSSKHVNLPLNSADSHLSVDQEGFVVLPNGAGYILSDEYGPYIHFALPSGEIIYSLRPPPAIVPQTSDGTDRFTAETQPAAGRADNQGFEALTFDVKTSTLWAMLQSATIQDSVGGDKTTNRNTRLFGWTLPNGGDFRKIASPDVQLKYEYAVQLPASKKGKTYAQSEMTIIDSTTFLVLSRDGNGFGDTSSSSGYKQADLISTKAATNLAGTAYDQPGTPIAPQGTLLSSITPVAYASFVNLIDPAQLAKFGLHNGGAIDANLIASKLESLAIAPAGDASAPDDYLLFVVSDNDFITANGHQKAQVGANATYAGDWVDQPYSDAYAQQYGSADTQLFVYRLTLPGFDQFS